MDPKRGGAAVAAALLVMLGAAVARGGEDMRKAADALWAAREDPGKAQEAIGVHEALLRAAPSDYGLLLRLSRLYYRLGQDLEERAPRDAVARYAKGREFGRRAAEAAPAQAGGYFFWAANAARENSLKGVFSNLFGVKEVRRLNEKAASLEPGYFAGGPDRFFCAYYTRLPGVLGGDAEKAVEHGKRAVGAFPSYAGNRVYLAEAYLKAGKKDAARRELEAAAALPDDAIPEMIPEQRAEKRKALALLSGAAK